MIDELCRLVFETWIGTRGQEITERDDAAGSEAAGRRHRVPASGDDDKSGPEDRKPSGGEETDASKET